MSSSIPDPYLAATGFSADEYTAPTDDFEGDDFDDELEIEEDRADD